MSNNPWGKTTGLPSVEDSDRVSSRIKSVELANEWINTCPPPDPDYYRTILTLIEEEVEHTLTKQVLMKLVEDSLKTQMSVSLLMTALALEEPTL